MPILALNCRSQVEQVNFVGNNSDDDSLAQALGRASDSMMAPT